MLSPAEIDREAWRIANAMLAGEENIPFDLPSERDARAVMMRLSEIVGPDTFEVEER